MTRSYALWDRMGTEIEYMVVDAASLSVRPLVPQLLEQIAGVPCEDFCAGAVTWSNELAAHVIEFKMTDPASIPPLQWAELFGEQIRCANDLLRPLDACLLPTGAHPWMDPAGETVLWHGESAPVYAAYDRIFGCSGHGWSNLQSSHLNLSFAGDEEFTRLHAAIRALLPLMPALSASSPYLDGRRQPWLDSRLDVYRHNQERVPVITGNVIPEAVWSEADYERQIYAPIRSAMAGLDPEGILEPVFLNSRGAIARFDRSAVEIRVLDTQECPLSDLAVQTAVIEVLRLLVAERFVPLAELQSLREQELLPILLESARAGSSAMIWHPGLLHCLGLGASPVSMKDVWGHLLREAGAGKRRVFPLELQSALDTILMYGSLAERIVRAVGPRCDRTTLHGVYRRLADSLASNTPFVA